MASANERRSARGRRAKPMTHARARLLSHRACYGEVTLRELKEMALHLRECPACRREADEMAEFVRWARRAYWGRRPRPPLQATSQARMLRPR
jgi:predicted anti-sigma-YlaC factor YlaD